MIARGVQHVITGFARALPKDSVITRQSHNNTHCTWLHGVPTIMESARLYQNNHRSTLERDEKQHGSERACAYACVSVCACVHAWECVRVVPAASATVGGVQHAAAALSSTHAPDGGGAGGQVEAGAPLLGGGGGHVRGNALWGHTVEQEVGLTVHGTSVVILAERTDWTHVCTWVYGLPMRVMASMSARAEVVGGWV